MLVRFKCPDIEFPTGSNESTGHQGAALHCTSSWLVLRLIFVLSGASCGRYKSSFIIRSKWQGGDKSTTLSTEFTFNLFIQSLYEVFGSIELGQLVQNLMVWVTRLRSDTANEMWYGILPKGYGHEYVDNNNNMCDDANWTGCRKKAVLNLSLFYFYWFFFYLFFFLQRVSDLQRVMEQRSDVLRHLLYCKYGINHDGGMPL